MKLRIVRNYFVDSLALSDEADDRGNRDARTGDARYASHDTVVDGDPLEGHTKSILPPPVGSIYFDLLPLSG